MVRYTSVARRCAAFEPLTLTAPADELLRRSIGSWRAIILASLESGAEATARPEHATLESQMTVEEGKAAPAFSLKDASGKKISLKDFRGKNVIVYFYPKDDTPGCTKEACGFRDHWKKLQKQGAVVLGISPDDERSHKAFIAKLVLEPILEGKKKSNLSLISLGL